MASDTRAESTLLEKLRHQSKSSIEGTPARQGLSDDDYEAGRRSNWLKEHTAVSDVRRWMVIFLFVVLVAVVLFGLWVVAVLTVDFLDSILGDPVAVEDLLSRLLQYGLVGGATLFVQRVFKSL